MRLRDYQRMLDVLALSGTERARALEPIGVALGAEVLAADLVAHGSPPAEVVTYIFFTFLRMGVVPTDLPAAARAERLVVEALDRVKAVEPAAYARASDPAATRTLALSLVCLRGRRLIGHKIECALGWPLFDIHVLPVGEGHRSLTEARA